MAIDRKCYSSSQCGAGFACIGNECVRQTPNLAAGSTSGCGDSSPLGGGGGGGCGGGGGGCSQPGCGGNPPCPPGPSPNEDPGGSCNVWCDNYLKANGELAQSCKDALTCPECKQCKEVLGEEGATCVDIGAYCFCENRTCPDCTKCNNKKGTSGYGSCQSADDTCLDCCDYKNNCSCGVQVRCQICAPKNSTWIGGLCRECIADKCAKACPPDDPPGCRFDDDCDSCDVCDAGTCVTPSNCNDPCGVITPLSDSTTFQRFPIKEQQWVIKRFSDGVSVGLTPRTAPGSVPQYYLTAAGNQTWYFTSPCFYYTEMISGCNFSSGSGCYAEILGTESQGCCSCQCPDDAQNGCRDNVSTCWE